MRHPSPVAVESLCKIGNERRSNRKGLLPPAIHALVEAIHRQISFDTLETQETDERSYARTLYRIEQGCEPAVGILEACSIPLVDGTAAVEVSLKEGIIRSETKGCELDRIEEGLFTCAGN